MGSPAPAGTIPVYMGDPLDLTLTFQGMNLMSYNHVAQIRKSAGDATTLATFQISKSLVGSDTVFAFHLNGDSAAGNDGVTRLLGPMAVFDLQQNNTDGSAHSTLVVGTLISTQDVTR